MDKISETERRLDDVLRTIRSHDPELTDREMYLRTAIRALEEENEQLREQLKTAKYDVYDKILFWADETDLQWAEFIRRMKENEK